MFSKYVEVVDKGGRKTLMIKKQNFQISKNVLLE